MALYWAESFPTAPGSWTHLRQDFLVWTTYPPLELVVSGVCYLRCYFLKTNNSMHIDNQKKARKAVGSGLRGCARRGEAGQGDGGRCTNLFWLCSYLGKAPSPGVFSLPLVVLCLVGITTWKHYSSWTRALLVTHCWYGLALQLHIGLKSWLSTWHIIPTRGLHSTSNMGLTIANSALQGSTISAALFGWFSVSGSTK